MFPTICLLTKTTPAYRADKKRRGLCATYRCRRGKAGDRTRCWTCNSRLHRYRHPEFYAWVGLKASARKRGIAFLLTFPEFQDFCRETGYMSTKGTTPESATINRKKRHLPYTRDNIELMSHADNSSRRYDVLDGNPF